MLFNNTIIFDHLCEAKKHIGLP